MPWVGLQCMIVAFPDHPHLLLPNIHVHISDDNFKGQGRSFQLPYISHTGLQCQQPVDLHVSPFEPFLVEIQ